MNDSRAKLVELEAEYDAGNIGLMEYELRKEEICRFDVAADDEINYEQESKPMKAFTLITTLEQYNALAAGLREHLPVEKMEEEQIDTSIEIQLNMLAGRLISAANSAIPYAEQKLSDAAARAKEEIERYDGSEVRDVKLQRATAWYETMKAQVAFVEEQYGTRGELVAAQKAYEEFFGRKWVPYSETQKLAEKARNTQAMADAKAALGLS